MHHTVQYTQSLPRYPRYTILYYTGDRRYNEQNKSLPVRPSLFLVSPDLPTVHSFSSICPPSTPIPISRDSVYVQGNLESGEYSTFSNE